MNRTLGCRVHFHGTEQTLKHIRRVAEMEGVENVEYSQLDDWEDLLILTGQVNYDHLFVIVSARKGSISYLSSFEKLPSQITRYFSNNSLLIIYPGEYGDDPQELTFVESRHHTDATQMYDAVENWFYKWFKKG